MSSQARDVVDVLSPGLRRLPLREREFRKKQFGRKRVSAPFDMVSVDVEVVDGSLGTIERPVPDLVAGSKPLACGNVACIDEYEAAVCFRDEQVDARDLPLE